MSGNNRATQAEQLIARMQAARGYIYPEWELAARMDPDFTEAYNRIYELALGEDTEGAVDARQQPLLERVVDLVLHVDATRCGALLPRFDSHLAYHLAHEGIEGSTAGRAHPTRWAVQGV